MGCMYGFGLTLVSLLVLLQSAPVTDASVIPQAAN